MRIKLVILETTDPPLRFGIEEFCVEGELVELPVVGEQFKVACPITGLREMGEVVVVCQNNSFKTKYRHYKYLIIP